MDARHTHGGVHLMDLNVHELRDLLQRQAVTPVDTIEACLARIAEREPSVCAFRHVAQELARAEAAAQAAALRRGGQVGPLAGVPIAVKDLEDVRGMPTTSGLQTSPAAPAVRDSVQVGRLRRAGAIVVGKTNTSADGFSAVTRNLLGPPSRNPWALDRSPGGSSGGSAAAVAARMVPWATSSDGGGSIRIPCSLTGCFGVKPTRGLIPFETPPGGVAPWLRHSVVGPTVRCVRDAAIYLDVTAGYDARDPDSAVSRQDGSTSRYEDAVAPAPGAAVPLRVGFAEGIVPGLASQPDVRGQIKSCMARVRGMLSDVYGDSGHRVECVDFGEDVSLPQFGRDWTYAVGAYRLARFRRAGLTAPEKADKIDRAITSAWPAVEDAFSLEAQAALFAKIADCNARLARVFERCDVLVAPSLGLEAYPANGPAALVALGEAAARNDSTDPFQVMMPLNYSGHPAAVIRAGFSDSGLPCAVQLIADRGREDRLLAVAALYERTYRCFSSWPSWPFRAVARSSKL
mmetsp:Transcript_86758/g.246040  ORF Transcript_86758/g.246040 Transcript_86758/m.246040 type:complete len:517 (-) Transcript_86758:31-1581(-)